MAQKEKTIEIKQAELEKFIYHQCPHYFYNFADGESCQRKVMEETCKLHVFADELNCPLDCPRLSSKEYMCDKGRCPRVKAIVRQMKA